EIYATSRDAALEAVYLNARLIAHDLAELGINVDCLPVLDMPVAGADQVIGDRAFASDPTTIIDLGRAQIEGLLEGGVVPVMKHIPGHGRAMADSHFALPRVATEAEELSATDFVAFRSLSTCPMAMNALDGPLSVRTKAALFAGCDVVLHCNGKLEEMAEVAAEVKELEGASLKR